MSKSEVLQIRLTKKEKEYIKKISRRNKMNMSEFLLYAVMKVISKDELLNRD